MSMCKSSYVEKHLNLANRGKFLITLIPFIVMAFLMSTSLQFSTDAYYYTLSSIFQGLFSILALAGIFVVFRIEQLSKDEDKYETEFKYHLREMKNQTIPDLSTVKSMIHFNKSISIMEWKEHNTILKHLDERNYPEYLDELKTLKLKFADENKKYEECLRKLELEVEENGKTKGVYNQTILRHLDNEDIEGYRKEGIDALNICDNHVKECEKKGHLINKNRLIKSKLLDCFKIPFLLGMVLISFTIFLLPMLNSNSGFWFQVPGNFVIGFLISLTIMVIIQIMLLIYYSIWSDEAKKTLI